MEKVCVNIYLEWIKFLESQLKNVCMSDYGKLKVTYPSTLWHWCLNCIQILYPGLSISRSCQPNNKFNPNWLLYHSDAQWFGVPYNNMQIFCFWPSSPGIHEVLLRTFKNTVINMYTTASIWIKTEQKMLNVCECIENATASCILVQNKRWTRFQSDSGVLQSEV